MYSDDRLILQLLSLLKQFNVRKIVVSPGSRHFSIIHSMEKDSFFQLYSVVDERSAAFFALGLIQKSNEPVAVACTSGTSTINYGSAVVEAFYQHLPLLLLTADRLPELLNQMEEQMFKQDDVFRNFVKFEGQLKEVKSGFDEWYCNRVINEGLLSLTSRGPGPVHLNIPIESHQGDTFSTAVLPKVRKITRTRADLEDFQWSQYAERLKGKRILVIWGQAAPMSEQLRKSLDDFCESYNCAILCDKTSNCRHGHAIDNAFVTLRNFSIDEGAKRLPDVVITVFANYIFNNNIKKYIRRFSPKCEHWSVAPSGDIIDPFHKLTDVFEMDEGFFFRKMAEPSHQGSTEYLTSLKAISQRIMEPEVPFSELYAVGQLVKSLPKGASLHIANSASARMANLFVTDESINAYCNRGVNGIDGCMSAAVGFAAAADEPVYLVIGDLTFFYDMNALWNRHLSKNLRILLLNNEGGAIMHLPLKESLADVLSKHISAGHQTSAKGWVESLGMKYNAVRNQEECDSAVEWLADTSQEGPMVLEVFTKKEVDIKILKKYFGSLNRETKFDKAKLKVSQKIGKYVNKNQ
ncbi:2-succinyl-5-enolpyruvyl-6-hydroxy-3-cyclohexene-1-carboxylic-acid synthase [Echinicola vietnamensis]|uniref:2-succinyl-5-enolpyruvyl-6-hydroxy-3-cyclohexene-1-carboxylate synthase n=1 Tax=Echinicola vietnamensis (strain DSM 17526 / LMG 23754 / KMM 6221) TaxID=926556 RepID=L0G4Y6_ECHVK|nr:2-succinyl-5-enolpyruvyl-6-hydroxy-3-cyclohexene-1-carboxylic-acid synthase [Echinicola vietnamensis]AGA80597.1 2-succinyl-5-enolpyruvyl-6-hydroxy-3-cyclohexene-1-carboxylic-acid synthase [Echinicola vietnamensis DSM 17526]